MTDRGSDVEAELDRDIGFVGAVALGVGTMIAAGIFVLSGLAVPNVGAMAIVSFLIAAVVASFTAFAYAEFSAIHPESGGGYAYLSNVFDTDLTYIVGWSMILGYSASTASPSLLLYLALAAGSRSLESSSMRPLLLEHLGPSADSRLVGAGVDTYL